jgi:hypothetical protein
MSSRTPSEITTTRDDIKYFNQDFAIGPALSCSAGLGTDMATTVSGTTSTGVITLTLAGNNRYPSGRTMDLHANVRSGNPAEAAHPYRLVPYGQPDPATSGTLPFVIVSGSTVLSGYSQASASLYALTASVSCHFIDNMRST